MKNEPESPLHEIEGARPNPLPNVACWLLVLGPLFPLLAAPFVEEIQEAMPWHAVHPALVAAGFALVGVPAAVWLLSGAIQRAAWRSGRLKLFPQHLEIHRFERGLIGGERSKGSKAIQASAIRSYRSRTRYVLLRVDLGVEGLDLTYVLGVPAPDEDALWLVTSWLDEHGVEQAN